MVCTRKNSRKNTRRNRKNSRKNMMGGKRASRKFSLTSRVVRPVGVLARGASKTVGTAVHAATNVLDSFVSGLVKTGSSAARAVNKTVSAAVSRRRRGDRRNRRH